MQTHFDCKIEKERKKEIIAKTKILGVPIIFGDKISNKIKFKKPVYNLDTDGYLKVSEKY